MIAKEQVISSHEHSTCSTISVEIAAPILTNNDLTRNITRSICLRANHYSTEEHRVKIHRVLGICRLRTKLTVKLQWTYCVTCGNSNTQSIRYDGATEPYTASLHEPILAPTVRTPGYSFSLDFVKQQHNVNRTKIWHSYRLVVILAGSRGNSLANSTSCMARTSKRGIMDFFVASPLPVQRAATRFEIVAVSWQNVKVVSFMTLLTVPKPGTCATLNAIYERCRSILLLIINGHCFTCSHSLVATRYAKKAQKCIPLLWSTFKRALSISLQPLSMTICKCLLNF